MPKIVAGTNGVMAIKVARITKYPICYSQIFRHPDGEKYFRFACDVEGEDLIVFNSMHPKPDEIIFETALIAETAIEFGANSVSCVFPYFAYARTLSGLKGEALPIKVVAKILKNSGIDRIYAVDFHLHENIFGVEFVDLTAMELLADYAKRNFSDELTVIAPDEHALHWAKIFAERFGTDDIVVLKKLRIDAENVIIQPIKFEVSGDAVVVDDIISTGATVCQAARIAKNAGSKRVFAVCTHAILASDALVRMLESGIEDIASTDTIPGPISSVSVADIIAKKLIEDFGPG